MTQNISLDSCLEFLKLGFFDKIFEILRNFQDYSMILFSLYIIENILKIGVENSDERIIKNLELYSCSKILIDLQTNPNPKIYNKIVQIIEKYYIVE